MEFKTEVNELLQLMIHSLYSNKEIFLRELISNASDALDKRSLARAAGSDADAAELEIKITTNEETKLLIIEDSGCGMSASELAKNLGTIAHSGTKAYLKEREQNADAAELIGQFGVGFYSAFMVADKIEVYSKAIGASEANCWSSDASGYEITPCAKEAVGTKIVLHLKDAEFASSARIEYLVKKYSKHINYAIKLEKPLKDAEGKDTEAKAYEQINSATAIWKENKSSLKAADYEAFFADISYGQKPLGWLHTNSEGSLEYNSLFFVPEIAPRDLMQMDYEKGCKLYVKRVLISEKEDLLPIYLRFIKGVIDVADLDLNVSREILQDNAKLRKISEISAKKLLNLIANFEGEKREKFNEQFGAVIKEGLLDPNAEHEAIYKALDFHTSKGKMSLEAYLKDHANEEKKIYFLQGENLALLEQNALVANYPCVVFLADRVDEFLSTSLPDFMEYKWQNIAESKIDSSCEGEAQTALAAAIKAELDARVREVKFSAKLGDKLAAIVYDAEDQTYQISKMMAKFGGGEANFVGDLLLNSEHALIKTALQNRDNAEANKFLAKLLFASANLSTANSYENAQALADAAAYFAQNFYEA